MHSATWTASFSAPADWDVRDLAEAYFCTCPTGEYDLESQTTYRLVFRRGRWVRLPTGEWRPGITQGDPDQAPVTARVLLRPMGQHLDVRVVHQAMSYSPLPRELLEHLQARAACEARGLVQYLKAVHGLAPTDPAAATEAPSPCSPLLFGEPQIVGAVRPRGSDAGLLILLCVATAMLVLLLIWSILS